MLNNLELIIFLYTCWSQSQWSVVIAKNHGHRRLIQLWWSNRILWRHCLRQWYATLLQILAEKTQNPVPVRSDRQRWDKEEIPPGTLNLLFLVRGPLRNVRSVVYLANFLARDHGRVLGDKYTGNLWQAIFSCKGQRFRR